MGVVRTNTHTHTHRPEIATMVRIASLLLGACASLVPAYAEESASDEAPKSPIVGIDLGTTYSCVAIYDERASQVEIIPNEQGNRITPSYVAFADEGRLVGDSAKNQLSNNPLNTIFDAKRFIGRKWDDPKLQADKKMFPFTLKNKSNRPYVEVTVDGAKKMFSPEEISAMVLGKMREIAEKYLGESITRAVVTVPAYFNEDQRRSTEDAGSIAGLKVERIINEPTAAALAYGLGENLGDEEKNILVFDLGGGTFDVSLLTVEDGVFEVRATNGDTHLGGEDFDQNIMTYFQKLFKKKHSKDIFKDPRATQKLRRVCEMAKRELSSAPTATLEIENLIDGIDFSETLSRARFEELNMDLFRSTLKPVKIVMTDADMSNSEVHEIVLVGGSTRIPKVQQLVQDFFGGKKPSKNINPDEAVAWGAAVQGAVIDNKYSDVLLVDINSLTLGIETVGGVMSKVIPRGTRVPILKSQIFSTAADNQPTVSIKVFEGERPMTKDNHELGNFDLTGIPPAPRGTPQIEVAFELDVNQMLEVRAEDKGTGASESIEIKSDNNRLSDEEIQKMIDEAAKYAEEDNLLKAKVEARNELEGYVYSLKAQIADKEKLGDKLSDDDKDTIENAIEDAIEWLESNSDADADDLKDKRNEVEGIVTPIISKTYGKEKAGGDSHYEDDEL